MTNSQMGWKEAIIKVLKESEEPLHYTDITETILKNKLVNFKGATPARTVSFYLTTDIDKNADNSIFERVGRGLYKIRCGVEPSYSNQINNESEKEFEKIELENESEPIKSLGMFWYRENVIWKNNPSIYGRQFSNTDPIDFKEQVGIYLLHDIRQVVYVGQSVDRPISQRLYEHTLDRLNGRWDRFSWFGFYGVDNSGSIIKKNDFKYDLKQCINVIEAVLIECIEPPLNRKRGNEFNGIEYLQVKDHKIKKKELLSLIESLKESL